MVSLQKVIFKKKEEPQHDVKNYQANINKLFDGWQMTSKDLQEMMQLEQITLWWL